MNALSVHSSRSVYKFFRARREPSSHQLARSQIPLIQLTRALIILTRAASDPYRPTSDSSATFMEAADTSMLPPVFSSDGRSMSRLPARVAGVVVRGLITFVFAAVGTVLGAITGGLIGLATESGLVRGTGIGAISGAVVAMEVVESSMAMWRSDESGIWSVLYVLDVIWSLLTGRLVREKVDPAVQNAVDSQMNAAESPFRERAAPTLSEMFDTGAGAKGMPAAAIDALPVVRFTEHTVADASGEPMGCSVCLQDFEAGEAARRLPACGHTFHLPCIDSWLLRHATCPLCRRAV